MSFIMEFMEEFITKGFVKKYGIDCEYCFALKDPLRYMKSCQSFRNFVVFIFCLQHKLFCVVNDQIYKLLFFFKFLVY